MTGQRQLGSTQVRNESGEPNRTGQERKIQDSNTRIGGLRKDLQTYQLSTLYRCSREHQPHTMRFAHSLAWSSAASWHRSHGWTLAQHEKRNQRKLLL